MSAVVEFLTGVVFGFVTVSCLLFIGVWVIRWFRRRHLHLSTAWEQGWHEHYLEHVRQAEDPAHPITKRNPYRGSDVTARSDPSP